jgi:uncharacterized membrane protein
VSAGTLHFVHTPAFEAIVPPYLPRQRELVYISGAAEIAGGVGVLIPRLRRPAGFGLIALLVAVFPANVHMTLNPEDFPKIPRSLLWIRLPLQGLLIAWVYGAAIRPAR